MIKAQISIIRKIAILAFFSLSFAFVIAISAPFSITSHAYVMGIESTQSAMDTLLTLGGLDGARPANGSQEDWNTMSSIGMSQDAYLALYGGFFDSANNYYSGLGDYLISRVKLAAQTGSLLLDQAKLAIYQKFIADTYSDTVGDTVTIGSYNVNIPIYKSDSVFGTVFQYERGGMSYNVNSTVTLDSIADNFVILKTSNSTQDFYWFVTYDQVDSSYINLINSPEDVGYSPDLYHSYNIYNRGYIECLRFYHYDSLFTSSILVPFQYLDLGAHDDGVLANYIDFYRTYGTLSLTNDLVSKLVYTDSQPVVSTTVLDNGVPSGVATVTIADSSVNSELISMLQNNVISIDDYLRALGVGLVNDGMTDEDKQAIIDGLSGSITNALTIGETGAAVIDESASKVGTLAHVEHAIANAIAQATGKPLPYPDEDPDYGPVGDPHIENWSFPNLDPDNPDPGGSEDSSSEDRNRAGDVIAGIGAVGTIASSVFNAASGFNLVTTIGFSFVIFSAILGTSHFFGAHSRGDVRRDTTFDWNRSWGRWNQDNTDFKSDW